MNTRKKTIVLIVFIFSVVIFYMEMAGADKAVAWIMDGYAGCKVTHYEKGEFKKDDAKPDMPLYPGDIVFKKDNIKSVLIQRLPYVKVQVEEPSSLTIILDAPKNKKTIFAKFLDWLGLAREKYNDVRGTSRGAFGHEVVSLENVTLLSSHPVKLDDYYKGKTLVFKQLDGKEVFRKIFKADLELNPGQASLEPGKMYIREVKQGETLDFRSTIRVLGTEDEDTVNQALAQIDRGKISVEERIIKKAAYLQFISDLYPSQLDLYWFSFQLLDKAEIKREGLSDLHEILLGCFLNHQTRGISVVDLALLDEKPGCLVTVELTRDYKKDFVTPDFPFKNFDEFSLYFQANFAGYCVVLHDSGFQTSVAFPGDSTGYQIKPSTDYLSNVYQFYDKPSIEYYMFILSDEPLEEIEKYKKISRDPVSSLTCFQPIFLKILLLRALIRRVKDQGQEIKLEIMGSKGFTRISNTSLKGIFWFLVSLEN